MSSGTADATGRSLGARDDSAPPPPLRVAVLCQYYRPEGGAASNRMGFFVRALTRQGMRVDVVTAMPSYPTGRTYPGYRGRLWMREEHEDTLVHRAWAFASPRRTALMRALNYSTFALFSLRWLRVLRRADVVLFSSGPMFAGFAAYLAAGRRRPALILDVRDLWPDRIWESGAAEPPRRVRQLLHGIAARLYRRSALVLCATAGLQDEVAKRIPETVPIRLLRNSAQVSPREVATAPERPRRQITVVDAGTIGWIQDPASLCQAFAQLEAAHGDRVALRVIGEGPRVPDLLQGLDQLKGGRYLGYRQPAQLVQDLAEADVGVVVLARTRHNRLAVARRVFDYAAAGLAIVYAGDGEGAELIRSCGAGFVVPPENPSALAHALEQLVSDPELLERQQAASRRLLEGEFSDEVIATRLVNAVRAVAAGEVVTG